MPVGFEEKLRLVEEHVLGVFMSARTAATLLGASRDEVAAVVELAEAGALGLEDLGLDGTALEAALSRLPEKWSDPETDAVRAAYMALAANRASVLEAVRDCVPGRVPGI